jgi:putative flippase GtrA
MPTIPRKDIFCGFVIGGGVGLLIQTIIANNLPAQDASYLTPGIRILIFLFFLVLAPCGLWIAKLISRWYAAVYQFAQFAAVGTLNSFIDVGVLNFETFLYGTAPLSNLLFAVFKAISFVFSTTNSFIWNKYWTFGAHEKASAREVSGFYMVAAVGWVLNVGGATLTKAFGPADSRVWTNIVAPLVGIAVSFIWDFLGYKHLVFKKKK